MQFCFSQVNAPINMISYYEADRVSYTHIIILIFYNKGYYKESSGQ